MPRCVTRRLLVLLDVVGAASRICVKHKCDASHLLFWQESSNLLSFRQLHNPRCIIIFAMHHHFCGVSPYLRCITIFAMHHHLCDASSSLRCIITSAMHHHLYDISSPLRYIITSAMHHHLCDASSPLRSHGSLPSHLLHCAYRF